MSNYVDPFGAILKEIDQVKSQQHLILKTLKEGHLSKLYTTKEVSIIIRVDIQTVRSYIKKGLLKETLIGAKKHIAHTEIYNNDGTIKEFKYKRIS
ncbi:helix-turn-helix domain-containing protein [Wenyingzhuangia aestuarii]|uniref:helix-turn-helix domain-containing protein n=1 Tax=Wenyingzhuangia aestuarii TaxID=1647582 RepID=UPI00143B65C0|nr:helix-turn-helix domain-containing protein [Wenyingzhuangia aestuarii]NJB82076.1 hypothetical protein [Wenyingzhuangia aestuarii]